MQQKPSGIKLDSRQGVGIITGISHFIHTCNITEAYPLEI
jgi:hypothetical protein